MLLALRRKERKHTSSRKQIKMRRMASLSSCSAGYSSPRLGPEGPQGAHVVVCVCVSGSGSGSGSGWGGRGLRLFANLPAPARLPPGARLPPPARTPAGPGGGGGTENGSRGSVWARIGSTRLIPTCLGRFWHSRGPEGSSSVGFEENLPFLSSAKIPLCDQQEEEGAEGGAGRKWLPWLGLGRCKVQPGSFLHVWFDSGTPVAP